MNNITNNLPLKKSELISIKECFAPVPRVYQRGEIITICSPEDDKIGIITSGTAYLSTINEEDQRRILDYYLEGEIFGKHFLPDAENKLFYIYAKTKCSVEFIQYEKILNRCQNNCEQHNELVNRLIMSSSRKALIHIDILSQRTLRSKILSYFEYLKIQENSSTFTLPLPLSDLADYLAADRSAMMRELKNLNDEKIIISQKRKITML